MRDTPHVQCREEPAVHVISLRFLTADSRFAAQAARAIGCRLPAVGEALAVPAPGGSGMAVLAWRSPNEIYYFVDGAAGSGTLAASCEALDDGYYVDLSGGIRCLTLHGPRALEFLSHLSSGALEPAENSSATMRMADVSVTLIRTREHGTALLVDALYAEHLSLWIDEVLRTYEAGGGTAM